jgi:hypothetical protein
VNDQIDPADAARALSEIGRRREQVIQRTAVPRWYWPATAVLMIALAADMESGRGTLHLTGDALISAGVLAINGLMLFRKARQARGATLHPALIARGTVARMLAGEAAHLAVVAGVGLATWFSLKAAGVPYPATIATAVAMAVYVVGGPAVARYNTALLVRRSGGGG